MEKKSLTHFPGPIALAKEAWTIYKKVFVTIVGLAFLQGLIIFGSIIASVIIGVIAFFVLGGKFGLPIIIVGSILFIVVMFVEIYFAYWFMPTYIVALREWQKPLGYRAMLKEGKTYLRASVMTALALGLIDLGAIFFFLIPEFIFSVWFVFWMFVIVIDNRRGLLALHTSREYVRGRFWGVLGRSIAVYVPQLLITLLLMIFAKGVMGSGLRQLFQIVQLFAMPFYMAYMYAMFMHLKHAHKEISRTIPQRSKLVYLIIPILGYILFVMTAIFVIPRAIEAAGRMMNSPFFHAPSSSQYPGNSPMMKLTPSSYPLPRGMSSST